MRWKTGNELPRSPSDKRKKAPPRGAFRAPCRAAHPARDLRRVIRKAVEDPAAEKLIDGTLASGSTLVVDADENGEIVLN